MIEQTFKVTAWTRAMSKQMLSCANTLNSRKIGRNRRGRLLLRGVDCTRHDASWTVRVLWEQADPRGGISINWACIDRGHVRRYQIYSHADHGKLVKTIKALEVA